MRKLIFVIFTVLGFGSVAQAADLTVPPPPVAAVAPPAPAPAPVCDTCDVFKNTRRQEYGRCVDCVQIPIKQARKGNVVLTLFDKSGRQLPNVYANEKGVLDTAGVERADLEAARGGRVEVCNDVDTKTLGPQEIDVLLTSGMPANHWLYLFAGRLH
jgi:hypothetical protein